MAPCGTREGEKEVIIKPAAEAGCPTPAGEKEVIMPSQPKQAEIDRFWLKIPI